MKMLSVFAVLLAAGLLVACTAAPSESPRTDTQAPSDTTPGVQDQKAVEPAPPAQEKKPAAPDARDAFAKAFAGSVKYTVAYDISATANGQTVQSAMTQYIDIATGGKSRMRFDSVFSGMESRSFFIDNTYTSCSKIQEKWNCFASEAPEQNSQSVNAQSSGKEYAEDDSTTIVRDGTMSIAGTTADCFLVTQKDKSSVRYCLKGTVPLYMKSFDGTGATVSELKATSFKTSVADADFVPPAKPSSMPAYGADGAWPAGEVPEGYDLPNY